MLKAVKKRRAYEDIVEQIRRLINKDKLRQGDQLPTEKELSETFKVSRLTVREAILSLETLNLVDRRQGNGTYVIATSEEALVKPFAAGLVEEKDNLLDVFAARGIIEPEVAQLAANNATPEQIVELERILEIQEKNVEKGTGMDSDFHRTLARMSKNRVLERLLFALMKVMETTREKYLQPEERRRKSLEGHREILAALKSGSPDGARRAMRRHLQAVENTVFKNMRGGERGH